MTAVVEDHAVFPAQQAVAAKQPQPCPDIIGVIRSKRAASDGPLRSAQRGSVEDADAGANLDALRACVLPVLGPATGAGAPWPTFSKTAPRSTCQRWIA